MKTLRGYNAAGALYHRGAVTEALVGDTVRLYLDTESKPAFPAYIDAVIQHPISSVRCGTQKSYNFLYDEADLDGAADFLVLADVVEVQVFATHIVIPPTTDPGIAGALWNNAGNLEISNG